MLIMKLKTHREVRISSFFGMEHQKLKQKGRSLKRTILRRINRADNIVVGRVF